MAGAYQLAQATSFQRFFRASREVCRSRNDSRFDVGRRMVDGLMGSGGGGGG